MTALAQSSGDDPSIWSDYDPEEHEGAPSGLGVGLIVGDPTGISVASRPVNQEFTIVGALAWSLPRDALHLHGDYLLNPYIMEDPYFNGVTFPFYIGLGARVRIGGAASENDVLDIGVRVPLGVSVLFEETPVGMDLFFELVPVIGLFPSTAFDLDGAIGIRFYPGWTL